MTRKPRADAAGNREHLVATARAAIAAEGVDLPVREIARRAGLGTATLYRHFPTRTDLITAALAGHVEHCRADIRTATEEPDAWTALSGLVGRFAERQIHAPGVNAVLLGSHPAGEAFRDDRRTHAAALEHLVTRAHRQRVLRPGVSVTDVRVVLTAIAALRTTRPGRGPDAVRTLTQLLLAGMRSHDH